MTQSFCLRPTMQLPRLMRVHQGFERPTWGTAPTLRRSAVRTRRLSCIAIVGSAASAARFGTEPGSLVELGPGSALRGSF